MSRLPALMYPSLLPLMSLRLVPKLLAPEPMHRQLVLMYPSLLPLMSLRLVPKPLAPEPMNRQLVLMRPWAAQMNQPMEWRCRQPELTGYLHPVPIPRLRVLAPIFQVTISYA
ncbi:MAG: hypothetical protein ACRESS_05985 [Stenotrophobium sp.]